MNAVLTMKWCNGYNLYMMSLKVSALLEMILMQIAALARVAPVYRDVVKVYTYGTITHKNGGFIKFPYKK